MFDEIIALNNIVSITKYGYEVKFRRPNYGIVQLGFNNSVIY